MSEVPGAETDSELLPGPGQTFRTGLVLSPGILVEQDCADRPGGQPGENARQRPRDRSKIQASRAGDGFARPSADREGVGPPLLVPGHPPRVVSHKW